MSNWLDLEKAIKLVNENYTIGCYNKLIEKISKKELKKIIDVVGEESTDIDIKMGRKNYVVELATIDNEKDFNIMTKEEYINRYGDERYED